MGQYRRISEQPGRAFFGSRVLLDPPTPRIPRPADPVIAFRVRRPFFQAISWWCWQHPTLAKNKVGTGGK